MSRLWNLIELALTQIMLLLFVFLSLGETFDLFNFIPANAFPMITVPLLIMSLSLLRSTERKHDRKLSMIHQDVLNIGRNYNIEYFYLHIDEHLRKAVGDSYFRTTLLPYQTALKEHSVHLNGTDLIPYFRQTLSNFPAETFISSVTLQTMHFWLNDEIGKLCMDFISHGGKLRQVFFVSKQDEVSLQLVKDFCAQQKALKIDVVVVAITTLHGISPISLLKELRENLFVGLESNIMWEISTDNGNIGSGIVTTDVAKVEHARHILSEAYKHVNTRKTTRSSSRKRSRI